MNNSPWPMVTLGEVIAQHKEFITIDDLATYKRCRVQLHAQGVVLRDEPEGARIKTKSQQVCHTDEFLVAEIDAKVGGFGIVPPELAGAIVSSHYFLFVINQTRLDKRFLDYFIRTPDFQDQVNARGSTNYAAIRPHHVLAYEIPLPPLTEQRRIVARIETLAAKVEAARELREEAVGEVEGLKAATLRSVREMFLARYPSRHLGNIARITAGGTPSREVPDYWNGHIPWIKSGELQDNIIYDAEEYITQEGVDNSSAKLFPIDTVLIALYGQGQTRGRTGLLKTEATTNQACCAVLPAPGVLEPRYTQYWLRSLYYEMREQVRNGAQPNWNARMIKMIEIAVPPLPEQHRIVAHLDALQAKLAQVQQHQAATQSRLDALLPSILDRAFKGEL